MTKAAGPCGNSFLCPLCGGGTTVTDTRPNRSINAVRRRRACLEAICGHRFTTMEVAYTVTTGVDPARKNAVLRRLEDLRAAIKRYIPTAEWDEL